MSGSPMWRSMQRRTPSWVMLIPDLTSAASYVRPNTRESFLTVVHAHKGASDLFDAYIRSGYRRRPKFVIVMMHMHHHDKLSSGVLRMQGHPQTPNIGLDPDNWDEFRDLA